MLVDGTAGLFAGAIALGAVHGIEPGHGWPIAAAYALDSANRWAYGLAAGLLLGVGHLVSNLAVVGAFFLAKDHFSLTQVNEPIAIGRGIAIGGPVSVVAGLLLVALGIREYTRDGHGHSHGFGTDGPGASDVRGHDHPDHSHDHDHHGHGHDGHDHDGRGHDGHGHDGHGHDGHGHGQADHDHEDPADRSLLGLAWFAFLLGFAHEEEFEIIALCAGSAHCLELMSAYALTVLVGIVGLTMALVAGYERFEDEVAAYAPYLPTASAAILIAMGIGFLTGLF